MSGSIIDWAAQKQLLIIFNVPLITENIARNVLHVGVLEA